MASEAERTANQPTKQPVLVVEDEASIRRGLCDVLAFHGYAPEEPKGKGADLRLLDLDTGQQTNFGNVAEMAWSEDGSIHESDFGLDAVTGEEQRCAEGRRREHRRRGEPNS